MLKLILDIQHRFHVDGHVYVVEVCAPSRKPAPISAGSSDTHITLIAPEEITDFDGGSAVRIASEIQREAQLLLPNTITRAQWDEFSDRVSTWVNAHLQEARREDWRMEKRDLEFGASDDEIEEA